MDSFNSINSQLYLGSQTLYIHVDRAVVLSFVGGELEVAFVKLGYVVVLVVVVSVFSEISRSRHHKVLNVLSVLLLEVISINRQFLSGSSESGLGCEILHVQHCEHIGGIFVALESFENEDILGRHILDIVVDRVVLAKRGSVVRFYTCYPVAFFIKEEEACAVYFVLEFSTIFIQGFFIICAAAHTHIACRVDCNSEIGFLTIAGTVFCTAIDKGLFAGASTHQSY